MISTLITPSLYEQIQYQLKDIDTTELSDDVSTTPVTFVAEEQKVYFWTRLYLSDDSPAPEIGDDISIIYTIGGEKLKTKFICYGKKGLERDHNGEITSYNPEDDTKILCLMIDSKVINYSNVIPFLRTLFKSGFHYEYQLIKRDELIFVIDRSATMLNYYDVEF